MPAELVQNMQATGLRARGDQDLRERDSEKPLSKKKIKKGGRSAVAAGEAPGDLLAINTVLKPL